MKETPFIFESPDGGKTIYSRQFGSNHRELIGSQYDFNNSHTDSKTPEQKEYEDRILWNEIRQAAKTDSTLQKALEGVKILYYIKKNET